MNEAVAIRRGTKDVAAFKPETAKRDMAKADNLLRYAKEIQDWPLLEQAIDWKIEQQVEFVRWWKERVTGNRHNVNAPENAERGFLAVDDAEKHTGITQQQVSKWWQRLRDIPKYRAGLFETEWRKAMAVKGQTAQRGASGTGENEWYTPPEYLEAARDVGSTRQHPSRMRFASRADASAFMTPKAMWPRRLRSVRRLLSASDQLRRRLMALSNSTACSACLSGRAMAAA